MPSLQGNLKCGGCRDLILMEYLFAIGFVSILGQVVLLRELSVAFYGVELIYTLAIGIWLFWGACGAMISRRTLKPSHTWINLLFIALSIGLPFNIAFIRSVRLLFTGTPGAYLPLHVQIAALSASLMPLGMILGLLFQWAAKIYISDNKSLAGAYGIESLGGLAGGICSSLFLRFGFQNLHIALFCALAAIGASFLKTGDRRPKWLQPLSIVIAVTLICLLWGVRDLDHRMTSWAHPSLLETRDTPYSRVTVTQLNGQIAVFENDALLFSTEDTRAEEFVHLAALQHPNPETVLILGGGIEGTLFEVLKHGPRRVDFVELNPALLNAVTPFLPAEIQKSFRDRDVRIILDDPRHFLDRALSYDLILVGMPEPSSGQANRFYTLEFFRQCLSKLNAQGILAFSMQASENVWTPPLKRRMVSIYRAAKMVFPDVAIIPGVTNVFIGSKERLATDPSDLVARLKTRGIRAKLVSAPYIRYRYTNDRYSAAARTLEAETAPVNTDSRPICYQYTLMIWLSKFLPSAKSWDLSVFEPGDKRMTILGVFLALSLVALLLSRSPWTVRRACLAGMAGFAGMSLETILMLHFQTKNGILYQDVGILLTGFMAGLALGAFTAGGTSPRNYRALGIVVLGGFLALSAGIGWRIASGADTGMAEILAALALAGFLVAGIFAYSSLQGSGDQRKAVAGLYSSDLLGGCLGSLVASLFLAPMAGLSMTAYLMVPLAIVSALLL